MARASSVFDLSDAVNRMRGPVGTSIQLTIARGKRRAFDVNLTREIIAVKSVTWKLDKDIGYLRVSAFNEKTGDALEEAVRAMRKQAGAGLKGVVLDLRNNPGGLLDQSVQVSDAFLDGGRSGLHARPPRRSNRTLQRQARRHARRHPDGRADQSGFSFGFRDRRWGFAGSRPRAGAWHDQLRQRARCRRSFRSKAAVTARCG